MTKLFFLSFSLLFSTTIFCMDDNEINNGHINQHENSNQNDLNTDENNLYQAVVQGNVDRVRHILTIFPQLLNEPAENGGETPLWLAAAFGHVQIAQLLLDLGANMNMSIHDDENGNNSTTPLHATVLTVCDRSFLNNKEGKLKVAQLLLHHKANVEARDLHGETPLHYAASEGTPDMIHLLLQHHAQVNSRDIDEQTPLHHAVTNTEEVIRILLDKGAEINARDNHQETPFHIATSNNENEGMTKIFELLVKHHADVNAVNDNGDTPLHVAARNQTWKEINVLLKNGAHINALNHDNQTPLHVIVDKRDLSLFDEVLQIALILLQHGAHVEALDKHGRTPLQLILDQSITVLKKELDITCNSTTQLRQIMTELANKNQKFISTLQNQVRCCCRGCLLPFLEKLFKITKLFNDWPHYQLHRNQQLVSFSMAQHERLGENSPAYNLPGEIVHHITQLVRSDWTHDTIGEIHRIATIERKKIMLQDAASTGNTQKVKELIRSNPELASARLGQSNLLHIAAHNGYIEIVKLLLQSEADLNALDSNKKTSYQIAVENNHTNVAQLLVDWPFYKRYKNAESLGYDSLLPFLQNDSEDIYEFFHDSIEQIHNIAELQRTLENSLPLNFEELGRKRQLSDQNQQQDSPDNKKRKNN